ncbi:MAG: hypothetical protein M3541_08165 [Acidobacteriota bacterium]|nr:hypothetical protein [Acidobacteriota bacterium]
MKIRSVGHNNRKKVFEVGTSTKKLVFPFSKAVPTPTTADPVTELWVDPEAGREAFTYVLHSGRAGTVHVEQVLEYNKNPKYLRDLLLYRTRRLRRLAPVSGINGLPDGGDPLNRRL